MNIYIYIYIYIVCVSSYVNGYMKGGENKRINMDLLKEAFAYTEQLATSFNATADEEMELEMMASKEERAFNSVKQSRGSGSLSGGLCDVYIDMFAHHVKNLINTSTYLCEYVEFIFRWLAAPDRGNRSSKIMTAYNDNGGGSTKISNKQKKSMVKKLRNQTTSNPHAFDAGTTLLA